MIRQGCSNQGIADQLGITRSGAAYHVSEIISKLGVSSREEAALIQPPRAFVLAPLAGLILGPLRTAKPLVIGLAATGAIAVTAGLSVLVLGGSGADVSLPESFPAPTESTATDSGLLSLLRYFPDPSPSPIYVRYIDYDLARRMTGVDLPPTTDPSGIFGHYDDLAGAAPFGWFGSDTSLTLRAADWQRELGFNFLHVSRWLGVGTPDTPIQGVIMQGRFVSQLIEDAILSGASFSAEIKQGSYMGVPYFSRFEDDERVTTAWAPPYRGPWRLVVTGDLVYWTVSTSLMRGMIDAMLGEQTSLANASEFQQLAGVFAKLNMYSASIWSGLDQQELNKRRDVAEGEYRIDEATAGGYLEPYTALAVGMGHDGVDPYEVLVFVHADQEAAAANAVTLRRKLDTGTRLSDGRPWSDSITRREIEADGTLVYARIWTPTPLLMLDAYSDLESIFLTH